jgi:hypothetical protein
MTSSPSGSAAVLVGAGAFLIVVVWTLLRTTNRQKGSVAPPTVIVRCRQGHVFTTVWVPFVTFKAIRVGILRIQYCPVGDHVTVVVPVNPSSLSEAERRFAEDHRDSLVP